MTFLDPNPPERIEELRAQAPTDWQRVGPIEIVTPEQYERDLAVNALDRLFLATDPEAFYARFRK